MSMYRIMVKYSREKHRQVMLWNSTIQQLDRYIEFNKKKWSYNDAIRDLLNQFEWQPHQSYFVSTRA